jgi:hypothetical protein
MSAPRRRRKDLEEGRPFWRNIPHQYLYPALGFVLGLGSPVGAFILRYWLADPVMRVLWMRHELDYNFLFYAYMGVGTVTSFMTFGWIIGLRSEAQRVRNRILSARVDELHLKSVTDGLTGAYTHGYLHEVLELEIQHALTTGEPLSVMVVDIDDFKRINDGHGPSRRRPRPWRPTSAPRTSSGATAATSSSSSCPAPTRRRRCTWPGACARASPRTASTRR